MLNKEELGENRRVKVSVLRKPNQMQMGREFVKVFALY